MGFVETAEEGVTVARSAERVNAVETLKGCI
jgi:hypothetical protein